MLKILNKRCVNNLVLSIQLINIILLYWVLNSIYNYNIKISIFLEIIRVETMKISKNLRSNGILLGYFRRVFKNWKLNAELGKSQTANPCNGARVRKSKPRVGNHVTRCTCCRRSCDRNTNGTTHDDNIVLFPC